jgi:hypothetical protein
LQNPTTEKPGALMSQGQEKVNNCANTTNKILNSSILNECLYAIPEFNEKIYLFCKMFLGHDDTQTCRYMCVQE